MCRRTGPCPYCLRHDRSFVEQRLLDRHIWEQHTMHWCYVCPICSGWLTSYRNGHAHQWCCNLCNAPLHARQITEHFHDIHFASTSSVNTVYVKRRGDFRDHMHRHRQDAQSEAAHHQLANELHRHGGFETYLTVRDDNFKALRCCDHCSDAFSGMADFVNHAQDITMMHATSAQRITMQIRGHFRLPRLGDAWQGLLAQRGLSRHEHRLWWNAVGAAPSTLLRNLQRVWCVDGPSELQAVQLAEQALALASWT